jgi:hypothetical protein
VCTTTWRWLIAWRHLGWFTLCGIALSGVAGAVFAEPAGVAINALLSALGEHIASLRRVEVVTASIIGIVLMMLMWLADGGPRRWGRGAFVMRDR